MLDLYGKSFASRLLLGTAQYPSPESLKQAVKASGTEIVTVSLRRESARALTGQGFWALIEGLGCSVLPRMSLRAREQRQFVVRSLKPRLYRKLALVLRRDKPLTKGLREVIKAIGTLI